MMFIIIFYVIWNNKRSLYLTIKNYEAALTNEIREKREKHNQKYKST